MGVRNSRRTARMGCAASTASAAVVSNEPADQKKPAKRKSGSKSKSRADRLADHEPVMCPSMSSVVDSAVDSAAYVCPWEERTDETSGKIFYVHKETGEHVRNKPDPPPHAAVKMGTGLKAKRKSVADRGQ